VTANYFVSSVLNKAPALLLLLFTDKLLLGVEMENPKRAASAKRMIKLQIHVSAGFIKKNQ